MELNAIKEPSSEFPMHFTLTIATPLSSNEKAPSLLIEFRDQEKDKWFLYNPMKSEDNYVTMLTSYTCFLQRNGNILGATRDLGMQRIYCYKEKYHKVCKVEIHLINRTYFYMKIFQNGLP